MEKDFSDLRAHLVRVVWAAMLARLTAAGVSLFSWFVQSRSLADHKLVSVRFHLLMKGLLTRPLLSLSSVSMCPPLACGPRRYVRCAAVFLCFTEQAHITCPCVRVS